MILDALDEEHGLEPPSSEALSDQRPEQASQDVINRLHKARLGPWGCWEAIPQEGSLRSGSEKGASVWGSNLAQVLSFELVTRRVLGQCGDAEGPLGKCLTL